MKVFDIITTIGHTVNTFIHETGKEPFEIILCEEEYLAYQYYCSQMWRIEMSGRGLLSFRGIQVSRADQFDVFYLERHEYKGTAIHLYLKPPPMELSHRYYLNVT